MPYTLPPDRVPTYGSTYPAPGDVDLLKAAIANMDTVRLPPLEANAGRTFNATTYGMATGATGATNTAALQAAINACSAAGGGTVFISGGTYNVDVVAHPNTSGGFAFGTCVAAIKSNVRISGEPASPTLTQLKLINSASLTNDTQNRFFTNWNMNAVSGNDSDIIVMSLTLNGNCLNVGSSTACNHGVQFWNVKRPTLVNVIVKNMRGMNGGAQETFAIDCIRCQDFLYRDCVATCDDGGNTASGISASYSDRGGVDHCLALNMTNTQGFTYYACASIQTVLGYAGGNGATGINNEQSWDLTYTNCIAGAESALIDSPTAPVVFTTGAAHPNNAGFVCLFSHGGGRISYANCNARGNTAAGFRASGAGSFTATTGTTGTTVVLTTASFYQTMIGRYIQVGAGRAWVRITAVTGTGANATCTVDAAHGGASGDTVLLLGGEVEWKGGVISGNGNGVQPVDANATLKQLTTRMLDFTQARIKDNTLDLADTGNGSTNSVAVLSGILATTLTDNQVSGTEFYNPFPMDMMVVIAPPTAATLIRGGHPKATAQSAISTATSMWHLVPRGGAITATTASISGNVRWMCRL
jgi:hypothetical protein